MNKVLITVGNTSYRCEVAKSEEDRKKGLSEREFLPPDEGMLFVFPNDVVPQMYMKNTTIPLDITGINKDDEVILINTPEPNSEDLIAFNNSKYILEVNAHSGINLGDTVEASDSLKEYTMKILAPDGTAQGMLKGGERIFSRISTRKLISRAKKAFNNREDKELYEKDCKKLGIYAFKELYAQDHREQQYVKAPNNKESK